MNKFEIIDMLNEEIKTVVNKKRLKESVDIMKIGDLAHVIATRMGYDLYPMLTILQDAFRSGGDEEVKEIFSKITKIEIDDVGKGRYVFKNN